MANVVQGTSNGDYDLARSLHLYDTTATCLDAPVSCGQLDFRPTAWNWPANSGAATPSLLRSRRKFDEDSASTSWPSKILPFISAKFSQTRSSQVGGFHNSQTYVANALGAGLSLFDLLAGINAETEAAY